MGPVSFCGPRRGRRCTSGDAAPRPLSERNRPKAGEKAAGARARPPSTGAQRQARGYRFRRRGVAGSAGQSAPTVFDGGLGSTGKARAGFFSARGSRVHPPYFSGSWAGAEPLSFGATAGAAPGGFLCSRMARPVYKPGAEQSRQHGPRRPRFGGLPAGGAGGLSSTPRRSAARSADEASRLRVVRSVRTRGKGSGGGASPAPGAG